MSKMSKKDEEKIIVDRFMKEMGLAKGKPNSFMKSVNNRSKNMLSQAVPALMQMDPQAEGYALKAEASYMLQYLELTYEKPETRYAVTLDLLAQISTKCKDKKALKKELDTMTKAAASVSDKRALDDAIKRLSRNIYMDREKAIDKAAELIVAEPIIETLNEENKTLKSEKKDTDKYISELERKIKDLESSLANEKSKTKSAQEKRDKDVQKLSKEILKLEHRMKEMEEQAMFGHDN